MVCQSSMTMERRWSIEDVNRRRRGREYGRSGADGCCLAAHWSIGLSGSGAGRPRGWRSPRLSLSSVMLFLLSRASRTYNLKTWPLARARNEDRAGA